MKNKMNIWINARNGHKGVKRKKPCLWHSVKHTLHQPREMEVWKTALVGDTLSFITFHSVLHGAVGSLEATKLLESLNAKSCLSEALLPSRFPDVFCAVFWGPED